MDESVKCFYCDEEIEEGTVVKREVFYRREPENPDPAARNRLVEWIWHPACEPSDWAEVSSRPWFNPELEAMMDAQSIESYVPAPLLARIRVLFRWNVMDRLRYLGLWPRRLSPNRHGRLPSGIAWVDLWRWLRTDVTCCVLGHESKPWFYDSYCGEQRYRCGRCDKADPWGLPEVAGVGSGGPSL